MDSLVRRFFQATGFLQKMENFENENGKVNVPRGEKVTCGHGNL